jgi:hypothetical protein
MDKLDASQAVKDRANDFRSHFTGDSTQSEVIHFAENDCRAERTRYINGNRIELAPEVTEEYVIVS